MKIGILTFHWATNYGAVLQTYALQEYLSSVGHEVVVINYKPKIYDYSFKNLFLYRRLKGFKQYWRDAHKDFVIENFRCNKLNITTRCYCTEDIAKYAKNLDVVITGSDQVLNPYFLKNGEGRGKISPAYFLGFDYIGKKVAYAVSFGCTDYPNEMQEIAKPLVKAFTNISVREETGISILSQMGVENSILVPDPTILIDSEVYSKIASSSKVDCSKASVFGFFIRNQFERQASLSSTNKPITWYHEIEVCGVEDWLSYLKSASFVITDSFHCMVMCLKLHTPFCVITEKKGVVGMNDRFYTLLGEVGLKEHILYKDEILQVEDYLNKDICWNYVDARLSELKQKGINFLNSSI